MLDNIPADLRNEMIYNADNLIQETSTVTFQCAGREDVFLRKPAVKRTAEAVGSDMPPGGDLRRWR